MTCMCVHVCVHTFRRIFLSFGDLCYKLTISSVDFCHLVIYATN